MKKRSNGEGSFRKLPSGNWSGQIMVGYTPEGKRRVKTFTAPTKSEVQRKIREYMDGLVEEEKAKSRVPFSAWADKWYASHRTEVEESTYCNYGFTLKRLKSYFGERPINEIKQMDINDFVEQLLNQNLSKSTIGKCKAMLFQIFTSAEDNEMIDRNPTVRSKSAKKAPKRGLALGSALRLAAYLGVSLDDLAYDRYANVLPTLPPVPRRDPDVSRRLKQHQELCDRLGRAGEAYVARLEREKLAGTPYANGVNEAFADDPSAGFDIQSFTRDGHPLCIEVKTTNGGADEPFYISVGERSLMEQCLLNGARYELHRVYHIFNKKKAGRVIYSAEELDRLFDFVPNDFRALRKKVAS